MTRLLRTGRRAFTLVELLVAMAVIVTLASIALLVVPDILDKDRTTDAASLTRQWLMIAKARAGRDGGYRGVRLVTGLDPQNPAKASPFWVTEIQFTEAPPVLVPNPNPTGGPTEPVLLFRYGLMPDGSVSTQANGRICEIANLPINIAQQITANGLLQLPALGSWHRITGITSGPSENPPTSGRYTVQVALDRYPDDRLGACGQPVPPSPPAPANSPAPPCYITFHFGITAPPQPLVGEPPLPLPKNICIDISPRNPVGSPQPVPYNEAPSRPAGTAGQDLDILFTPTGHVVPVGPVAGYDQIYLWFRDYTKAASPLVVTNLGTPGPPPVPPTYDLTPFQNGGEQQVLTLKVKSGSMGVYPVLWPNGTGQYNLGEDPYTFARNGGTDQ